MIPAAVLIPRAAACRRACEAGAPGNGGGMATPLPTAGTTGPDDAPDLWDPDRARRTAQVHAQLRATVTILVAVWITFSPSWWLPYPLSYRGRDTGVWQSGPGLVVLLLAVCRYRAPLTAWRSAVLLVVLGAGIAAMPFVAGWSPSGELAVAWWNALLAGAALTLVSAAALVQLVRRA